MVRLLPWPSRQGLGERPIRRIVSPPSLNNREVENGLHPLPDPGCGLGLRVPNREKGFQHIGGGDRVNPLLAKDREGVNP